jgi:hypothetical protein
VNPDGEERTMPHIPKPLRALAGLWATALVGLAAGPARAVVLDDENRVSLTLSDGTTLTLLGEATSTPGVKTHNYYYLPTNLRLGGRPDGTPEFLFLKFVSDRRADAGGVSGAILHFLMQWGLTPAQETEAREKLKQRFRDGQLMGAVPLETPADASSFQIVSATLSDGTLTKAVVTSGKAPLVENGKAAAGSRLTPEGASLLAASFEKTRSITDLSIALTYAYSTLAPAARGSITIDWSKLERESQSLRAEYKKTEVGRKHSESCFLFFCASDDQPEYAYSYEEARAQYKLLEEKQIVRLQFDELIADERVAKIREAFFQFFLNSMASPAATQQPPPAPSDAEKEKSPDIRYGNRYRFNQSSFKQAVARKTQRFDLNYRTTVKWPLQLVGNLASWYDGVRDNPKCVGTVNVDNPIYDHRDISFILDLDAKEIFDETVNFVTVNVRKARSTGPAFEARATIDAAYVQKKGINATVTYARGEDTNPDAYEYQARWSIKGGHDWPANPPWVKGAWEGVTLAPPVVPRTIEVEGDLERMKASGITRATVEIRYPKLGEEAREVVQLSPAKGEPIVSKKLFVDRGSKGYVYRVILNHQTEGKLVLPWSAQLGDNYVYVTIPPDLLTDGPLKTVAKEAARTLETTATEKVLDKFKDVLGGIP